MQSPSHKHFARDNSGSSTLPGLSISTSTSCASSVLSASPTDYHNPYYYYSSPSSTSSPSKNANILIANGNPPARQPHRSLEKRSLSASVRLRRRTSSPLLPPQRSASAGSNMLKESSGAHFSHHHLHSIAVNDTTSRHSAIKVAPSPQRWDDSQLAMELADDLPSESDLSSRNGLTTKVRQWITPTKKQKRRPFNQWLSDMIAWILPLFVLPTLPFFTTVLYIDSFPYTYVSLIDSIVYAHSSSKLIIPLPIHPPCMQLEHPTVCFQTPPIWNKSHFFAASLFLPLSLSFSNSLLRWVENSTPTLVEKRRSPCNKQYDTAVNALSFS